MKRIKGRIIDYKRGVKVFELYFIFLQYIDIDVGCFNIKCGKPIEMVLSSQFCHGTFMRMRNELIETVTMPVFYNSSCDWTECRTNQAEVCDLRAIYADTKSYNEAQYKAFCTIYRLLFRINRSENVLLVGFPLFTQFNVNLLCLLNTLFRTVSKNKYFIILSCNIPLHFPIVSITTPGTDY